MFAALRIIWQGIYILLLTFFVPLIVTAAIFYFMFSPNETAESYMISVMASVIGTIGLFEFFIYGFSLLRLGFRERSSERSATYPYHVQPIIDDLLAMDFKQVNEVEGNWLGIPWRGHRALVFMHPSRAIAADINFSENNHNTRIAFTSYWDNGYRLVTNYATDPIRVNNRRLHIMSVSESPHAAYRYHLGKVREINNRFGEPIRFQNREQILKLENGLVPRVAPAALRASFMPYVQITLLLMLVLFGIGFGTMALGEMGFVKTVLRHSFGFWWGYYFAFLIGANILNRFNSRRYQAMVQRKPKMA